MLRNYYEIYESGFSGGNGVWEKGRSWAQRYFKKKTIPHEQNEKMQLIFKVRYTFKRREE